MRKRILSSTLAAILLFTNVKTASSVEEVHYTTTHETISSAAQEDVVTTQFTFPRTVAVKTVEAEPKAKPKITYEEYGTFSVTAYTSGYESTQKKKGDPGYGRTASGTLAKEGRTAACPRSIPFGVEIYIPELNHTYVCEDRGGAIKAGHLDLYFDNLQEAKDFGRQRLSIKAKINHDF
ncbi:3D domain-containing protein [Paenibacillus cremeus]|uniref:3D domain-containing protein n=1 Tax=Paenibacillus cremeus TaxID=2163881 RepID=A0A559KG96_9BACL|nr:3D domain-containing protein [Paenibacillus cremeus]TVY11149.1 hypothetical protein FPZ49_04755 [Paenibacillus cremeus]